MRGAHHGAGGWMRACRPPICRGAAVMTGRSRSISPLPRKARASAAAGRTSLRRLLLSGSGQLLVYVWGGGEPRGTIVPNPYTRGRGVYLIQRPASTPTGQWQSENVDLEGDYQRAFGQAPGILVGLAVASDSDDVDGINRARLADLTLAG